LRKYEVGVCGGDVAWWRASGASIDEWDVEITDGGWDGDVVAEAELTPNTRIPDVVVDRFVRVPDRPTPAGELAVVEFEVGSDVRARRLRHLKTRSVWTISVD
jgi:hypothetical protein